MKRTPEPIVDVARVVPELAPLARITVRLHPRRAAQDLPTDVSKIGGRFQWPAQEAWPECPEHGCSLVSVLQLRSTDVPELGFPEGVDLFQILWCPNDHDDFAPAPRGFWRSTSEVGRTLTDQPRPAVAHDSYLPHICKFHPERVTEYPDVMDLSDSYPDIMEQIDSSDELNELADAQDQDIIEDVATLYQYWLSVASGIKVAGYPNWSQFPNTPECACGRPMDYLLTLIGDEFDGGTWQRWATEEDRAVLEDEDFAARAAIREPTGLLLGRGYAFNFFVCRHCEGWPIKAVF